MGGGAIGGGEVSEKSPAREYVSGRRTAETIRGGNAVTAGLCRGGTCDDTADETITWNEQAAGDDSGDWPRC